jgi:hypothetical protein
LGADRLVDACLAGQPSHDPPGGVPIEPLAVAAAEDGSFDPLTDGQVDRTGGARRERDWLTAMIAIVGCRRPGGVSQGEAASRLCR